MDQKTVRPFVGSIPINYEKYRAKIVRVKMMMKSSGLITILNREILSRVMWRSNEQNRTDGAGAVEFKIRDLSGDYIYLVKSLNFTHKKHDLSIMNGVKSEEKFKASRYLMNLAKEKIEVADNNSNVLLRSEYRGFRKILEVQDNDDKQVALLHASIISMRDRWKIEFSGDCDRYMVLIMAAIMSEMSER